MVLLAVAAFAADVLTPSAKYNPAVPAPRAVLGYNIGEAFTPFYALEAYYQKLAAAAPDRMRVVPYGKSYEGRTLYTAIISSPRNMARLNELKASWAKLADPRTTSSADATQLADSVPALVWLGYSVHGNEASGAEAGMQVAYELLASQDENVARWLESCVVIIDPSENPDGRDRYINYFRQWQGKNARGDRFAAEHQERWPGGRVNHYFFDLNRDWAWQSQQETVARVAAIREWHPQVLVDFHEMGANSTYFFPPPAKPVMPTLEPLLGKWFEIYGRGNAAAFDKYGFRYYTKESFDLLYPSYGDIWPSMNGAVGMTYEQGGGPQGGLVLDLPDQQRTLKLADRVAHHFVASLATINTSAEHRQARLLDYYNFRRAAVQQGQTGAVRAYYLVPGRDPERVAHAIDVLLKQGVEVKRMDAAFDADDLTGYWANEKIARRKLPAGTYVIDAAQPAGFLARALLEREIKPDTIFFYDVSSWSLPLMGGFEAYSTGVRPPANAVAVKEVPAAPGVMDGAQQPAAYILAPENTASLRLLSHLLQDDVKAYVSLKAVRVQGREFAAGAIVIPSDTNGPNLAQRLRELAQADGAQVFGVSTSLSEEGIDLGSNRVRFLRKPRIAVVTDSPTSSTDYGALWYLFEQRMDIAFTPLRAEELRSIDLKNYNVLVLPPDYGAGNGYARVFDKGTANRISEWVRDGGLLIGIGGGAIWATKPKSGLTSVTYRFVQREAEEARQQEEKASQQGGGGQPGPSKPAEAGKPAEQEAALERKLMKYGDREKSRRAEEIAGAMLRVVVDNTHPLGFGMEDRLAVLDETAPILDLTSKGENPVYFPKDNVRVAGYITPENEKKLANTAFAVRERSGRGFVVLFAGTPVFRGFSDGMQRLLLNALFFGNITDPNVY